MTRLWVVEWSFRKRRAYWRFFKAYKTKWEANAAVRERDYSYGENCKYRIVCFVRDAQ